MRRIVSSFLAWPLLATLLLVGSGGQRPSAAQPSGGEKVVGGPYAVNVGPRSATVMWVMQTGEALVGVEPDKTDKSVPVLRAEKTTFTGLKPGTRYYYRAFPGDAGKGRSQRRRLGEHDFSSWCMAIRERGTTFIAA
jgi:hypothetical protein